MPAMRSFRTAHRIVMVIVVVFTLYLAVTGLMIQLIDLRSILMRRPASDPDVIAMRESFDGPGNYEVRAVNDSVAKALPENANYQSMLDKTMQAARLTVGNLPLRWVELRMDGDRPAGLVETAGRFAEFDPSTGRIAGAGLSRRTDSDMPTSARNTWKHLHRMTVFGTYALIINVVVGIGLLVLIVTGLVMYLKMLSARARAGRGNLFWESGDAWRAWHRYVSIVSAIFLIVVSLSGLWLAYESLYFGFYMGSAKQRADQQRFAVEQAKRATPPKSPRPDPMSAGAEPGRLASMQQEIGLTDDEMLKVEAITDLSVRTNAQLHKTMIAPREIMMLHQEEARAIMAVLTEDQKPLFKAWREAQLLGMPVVEGGQGRGGGREPGSAGDDPSSPLRDVELPVMLRTTLAAADRSLHGVPIKVVRLRYYAGMPQGVVVTGGDQTKQVVFNAATGKQVSETEPGYPPVGFPFGWQAHQTAKDIHRGGVFGLPGRLLDTLAGLAMLYLSLSGILMYADMYRRRRKAGKPNPMWV